MADQIQPKDAPGLSSENKHFLAGMVGCHILLLIALVVTLTWHCPRILHLLENSGILSRPPSIVYFTFGISRFCVYRLGFVLAVLTVFICCEIYAIGYLLTKKLRIVCLIYSLMVVLGILSFQAIVLYGAIEANTFVERKLTQAWELKKAVDQMNRSQSAKETTGNTPTTQKVESGKK